MSWLPHVVRSGGLIGLLALLIGTAHAQQAEDTLGTHVVQPGDTLWTITAQYLGEDFLWRENWKLNPEIKNPNLLRIGQRLTVITERQITADNATLAEVTNQVDKNLKSSSWTPARIGDALQERDGVRTRENSSASLKFNDTTRLNLSEFSQVFLQSKQTDLRGVDRGQIEVRRGRVEMQFEPIARNPAQIELRVGDAVATPDMGPDGSAKLSAIANDSNGAAVMVYHGSSALQASGQTVALPRGTGSTVEQGQAPSPPEKLLPRPGGLRPASGSHWPVANPVLSWQAMNQAAGYRVEICLDEDCRQVVRHSPLLKTTRWQPELDRLGRYHWRVRGVSDSGLEGYASRTVSAILDSLLIDRKAPAIAVIPQGRVTDHDGRLIMAPDRAISLNVIDSGIGLAWVRYRIGGDTWQPWDGQAIDLPTDAIGWLEVQAADSLDNTSEVLRIELKSIE